MTPARRQERPQQGGREAARQRTIAELRERAASQARALVSGEDWAATLRLAARLPGWRFINILLIAGQRPGATVVAGYQAWQARGRQVRKREPGIQVIAEPRPSPGRPGGPAAAAQAHAAGTSGYADGARRTYVWDISQTDGNPVDLALPLPPGGGPPPGLWDALTWLARREGFAVERAPCHPADSLTNWSTRRILIRSGLDGPEAARALTYELGHVLAHGGIVQMPESSAAGCRGIRKVEADSIAFIVATRLGMDTSTYLFPYVASWAGNDPRARPEETIRATGERVTLAATTIATHLDVTLFGTPSSEAAPAQAHTLEAARGAEIAAKRAAIARIPFSASGAAVEVPSGTAPDPLATDISRILIEAEQFYIGHLESSWIPGYLATRGLTRAAVTQWRIGYAPAGWTALTSHLRHLGHSDGAIEAAGLARRSSSGTLIDHFRDRVMLAIRNEHGMIAGFIGRAHPEARPAVPRYLNSPETSAYAKGDLLFGLHEACDRLARGAVPVIVEGPFDAIAVTAADPMRFAGLAPCGTALTSRQTAALGRVADLGQAGVLVALDGDRAGREAAIKAYGILLPVTDKTTAVLLPADLDPAGILQADGPTALSSVLQHRTEPLARVVIDAHLDSWASQLGHPEGRLNAMRSAAALIASLLPSETVRQILQATGGRHIASLDDNLRPVVNPELPVIARMLPASAACQIARVADRLENDHSDVTAEVANAVSRKPAAPKGSAARGHRNDPDREQFGRADGYPARVATASFPNPSHALAGMTPNLAPTPRLRPDNEPALPRVQRR